MFHIVTYLKPERGVSSGTVQDSGSFDAVDCENSSQAGANVFFSFSYLINRGLIVRGSTLFFHDAQPRQSVQTARNWPFW